MKSGAAVLLILTAAFIDAPAARAHDSSIEGVWRTYVDGTHNERAWVQIVRSGEVYEGRLVRLFRQAGDPTEALCYACDGDLRNAPLIGMTILRELRQRSARTYGGGRIRDPETGQEYRCEVTMVASGKALKVRGYIGVPVFGRTQVWRRIESSKEAVSGE